MEPKYARAAATVELPEGASPPREILLLPAGRIPTRPHDGRAPWHNPDADAVVAATRELRLDLPVDYEHQGELTRKNGQPAPAAGWIKRLFARAGEVWGEVEWTARAAGHIKAREYRFISPAFEHDKATRVVKRIVGAALVNNPALYMKAIAKSENNTEEIMDLDKLRKALGLPDDADEKKILAAASAAMAATAELVKTARALGVDEGADAVKVTEAASASAKGVKSIAKAAGLEETATAGEIEKAVKAKATASADGDPDPEKFVPREEYDRAAARLTAIETERAGEKASAAVDEAVAAGKIAPAQREWALDYAKTSPDGFKTYAEKAPVIVAPGRIQGLSGTPPRDPDAALDAGELAVCKAMGIDPGKFKETRARAASLHEEAA